MEHFPNSEPNSPFFHHFKWHWEIGTNLDASSRERDGRWTRRSFANAMGRAGFPNIDPATIGDWLAGIRLPQRARKDAILCVFFPTGSENPTHDGQRKAMDSAWSIAQARQGKGNEMPLGETAEIYREWDVTISNRLAGVVELSVHQPRLANQPDTYYIDSTLHINPAEYEWDSKLITIGLTGAFLSIQSLSFQPMKGSMLGERAEKLNVLRRAGGIEITGPQDDQGYLSGSLLGDEYVAVLEPINGDNQPISIAVHAARRSFKVLPVNDVDPKSGANVVTRALTVEKYAIINILIERGLRKDEQGRAILAEAKMYKIDKI